ncbi:uncharacterized protein LOC122511061 isoform X1 [Leptopilina heterotoma]|uniref:uncharacterized protein LOC122511061 isoform X1 n=1 Tax=Leptopilina heterotoma TaxID=63436 RepID=UPI001CA7BC62|nr:uncharacterized protein LOC122511061 isoform X1 [Leptopilina heterotoma]
MYAAAGGASIANRRKQKRLQLNKRSDVATASAAAAARIKTAPATSHTRKFSRPHVVARPQSSSTLSAPPPSCAFHSSIERRRRVERCQQLAPVSPIQFPISPPPLSLESPSPRPNKSSNFPFPPPSILDLRVSPSATELQCGGQASSKAAWQGCNRSPHLESPVSPQGSREGYKTKQCEAHRRWMKRNRIRDASYCYGSSGEDDEEEGGSGARRTGEVSAAANTLLYAGLGTTALGLVISFVGTGEKGFLSPELRLIGPSLLCAGLLCCFLRVFLCICLCPCGHCRWKPCPCVSKKNRKKHKEEVSSPEPSLPTASLLSPLSQPAMPSSSCIVSPVTRGRELLLSPAQLPE